jgi:hypothetical protein
MNYKIEFEEGEFKDKNVPSKGQRNCLGNSVTKNEDSKTLIREAADGWNLQ